MRCLALALLVVGASACAPRLSPPYRDFAARDAPIARDRLAEAAVAAGWTLAPSLDPAVVTTEPRDVATGPFSRTTAALDLVPLAGGHVRVWVRGESRSVLGARTKVFALSPSLRARVLGPLTEALAARGLRALDAPRERDEDATEG